MISVRLDEKIKNQLDFIAQQNHIPKSKVIKDALVYYFDMLKKESEQKKVLTNLEVNFLENIQVEKMICQLLINKK